MDGFTTVECNSTAIQWFLVSNFQEALPQSLAGQQAVQGESDGDSAKGVGEG